MSAEDALAMSSRAALADCSSAAMRFCKASSSAGEIPAVEFLAASCTLARKSVTALAAASARSRAWLAVAAISSLRRLSAASAMPSDFMALSAAVSRSATPGSLAGSFLIASSILLTRWVSASIALGIAPAASCTLVSRRGDGAHRQQTGQPEREQDQRHGRRAGDTGGERRHAERTAGPRPGRIGGRGLRGLGGGSCAGGGGSDCGGGAASGGGISVAVRSMVGAARFLRRGACGAVCCAPSGVCGVVRLSAMQFLGESAHPQTGNNANGAAAPINPAAGSRLAISAASSGRGAMAMRLAPARLSGSAICADRQICRTPSACPATPACGRAGDIILGAALGKMQHRVDLAGLAAPRSVRAETAR